MATIAGTTVRGLPYPGDTGTAPDGPAAFKALADAIEAMMNSPLVLGSTLSVPSNITATGGTIVSAASGGANVEVKDSAASANVKRARLRSTGGTSRLQSIADDGSGRHDAFVHDMNTGVVNFPQGTTGKRMDSPYFRAYLSGTVSYATGATVVFNTETDPNGWYNNATGIFQPTVAGMYRVSWRLTTPALSSGNYFTGVLTGSLNADESGRTIAPASAVLLSANGSTLVAMNGTTDFLSVVLTHNQGGTIVPSNASSDTHFEAERIGA